MLDVRCCCWRCCCFARSSGFHLAPKSTRKKNPYHYLYTADCARHAAQQSSVAIGSWVFECFFFVGIVVILRAMSAICFIRGRQQQKRMLSLRLPTTATTATTPTTTSNDNDNANYNWIWFNSKYGWERHTRREHTTATRSSNIKQQQQQQDTGK